MDVSRQRTQLCSETFGGSLISQLQISCSSLTCGICSFPTLLSGKHPKGSQLFFQSYHLRSLFLGWFVSPQPFTSPSSTPTTRIWKIRASLPHFLAALLGISRICQWRIVDWLKEGDLIVSPLPYAEFCYNQTQTHEWKWVQLWKHHFGLQCSVESKITKTGKWPGHLIKHPSV